MILTRLDARPKKLAPEPEPTPASADVELRPRPQRAPYALASVPFSVSCRCVRYGSSRDCRARHARSAPAAPSHHFRACISSAACTPASPASRWPIWSRLLKMSKAELEFSLWYLTEGLFVKRTDNGTHSITLKGVDLAEDMIDRLPV